MTLDRLKDLRFYTPGIISIVFSALLGWITKLWEITIPDSLGDLKLAPPAVACALLYYLTPLRAWCNQVFADDVNENIRSKLVSISGLQDDPDVFMWKKLRRVFYDLVDNDESLKVLASQAYSNGFLWTLFADIRTLALVFVFISLFFCLFALNEALFAASIFALIVLISLIASAISTRRHMEIGNEQIETIKLKHKPKLIKMLEGVRDESDRSRGALHSAGS